MVSFACSQVAVLPVPIAHTGSYAMTILETSSMPLRPWVICLSSTSSVLPPSRSSSVSPMHTMGVSPAASAASVRLFTVSSVSPKYCLRSLCPMMTYFTPYSLSIAAEISPV